MVNKKVKQSGGCKSNFISADQIFDTTYKPPCQVIDGVLQGGLYILSGPPKIGKSFLISNIAAHVSQGIPFWGFPVHQGTTLCYSLEDDYGRIQRRLYSVCGGEADFSEKLYFAIEAGTLRDGFLTELDNFVTGHPDTKLVVVDPFQMILDSETRHHSYGDDYNIMTSLKQFCDSHDLCILLVHHTRKKEAADSFLKISGTTGIFGAVDGAFVMSKKDRTSNMATLEFTGRDLAEQIFTVEFDRQNLVWNLKDVDHEPWKNPPDPILEAIDNFLSGDRNEWHGTATDLISEANLDSRFVKPNALTRKLNVMVGELRDDFNIEYRTTRGHDRQIHLERILK